MKDLKQYLKFFIQNALTGEFHSFSYWKMLKQATEDVHQMICDLEGVMSGHHQHQGEEK